MTRRPRTFSGRRYGDRTVLLALIILVHLGLGCSPEPPLLYCGAGIKPPVAELVEQFERQHGVSITCDYRGSEVLLSSIKLTGKGDLYMPGDVHYIELADQEELIKSSHPVCYFVPVILVQSGNPKGVHTLQDLTRDDVRVGLGDPQFCAIGRKTSKLLKKSAIAEEDVNVRRDRRYSTSITIRPPRRSEDSHTNSSRRAEGDSPIFALRKSGQPPSSPPLTSLERAGTCRGSSLYWMFWTSPDPPA